jgi:hypothetical protein
MTVEMPIDVHAGFDDVTSPELALVDPRLSAVARARLPDAATTLEVAAGPVKPALDPALVVVRPRSTTRDVPAQIVERMRGRRTRWAAVCAVVTVLLLLLVDLRTGGGGGRAADVGSPMPTPGLGAPVGPSTPAKKAQSPPTERRFVWARTPKATGYHVEFFRHGRRVFVRDTTAPEVVVPARWIYAGRRRSLLQGQYTWYVWPVVGGRRAATAAVQATVSIPR